MSKINIGKYAILFFGCIAFHVIGTWSLPLIDRDEPRFAEASREMIERGDYIVPRFNNQLRLDKPPLAYWAQVASYKFSAKTISQRVFHPRSPPRSWRCRSWPGDEKSAATGLLVDGNYFHAVAPNISPRESGGRGHVAGFVCHARALGRSRIDSAPQPRIGNGGLFFICRSRWDFLAKGPIAWTPLLTLAAMKYFSRDIEIAKRFKFVRGILLMLALVALWGIPALIQTHGEFLRIGIGRHVIGRSFSAMESHGSIRWEFISCSSRSIS